MKFRKKPVVIDAIRWTGKNWEELLKFIPSVGSDWWLKSGAVGGLAETSQPVILKTLEGNMQADIGDWIIKGVKGEFYPCKPDIFEATYEFIT